MGGLTALNSTELEHSHVKTAMMRQIQNAEDSYVDPALKCDE